MVVVTTCSLQRFSGQLVTEETPTSLILLRCLLITDRQRVSRAPSDPALDRCSWRCVPATRSLCRAAHALIGKISGSMGSPEVQASHRMVITTYLLCLWAGTPGTLKMRSLVYLMGSHAVDRTSLAFHWTLIYAA